MKAQKTDLDSRKQDTGYGGWNCSCLCCAYPKNIYFKQQSFICTRFLWVGNPGEIDRCLWSRFFHISKVRKVWEGTGVTSAWLGRSSSKLAWVTVDRPWVLTGYCQRLVYFQSIHMTQQLISPRMRSLGEKEKKEWPRQKPCYFFFVT